MQPKNKPGICPTDPCSRLDQGVEHWLQIERRATDDLKHIAARGLVFERLLQIVCALLELSDQPRVVDCDERLRGEIL
jgi:hypothetical protein